MRHGLVIVTGESGDWQSTVEFDDEHVECVAASPDVPERIFCGTFGSGLYRSTDGGGTFEQVGAETIEGGQLTAVAVSPHDSDVIWAGTEPSEVFRSDDGGETWERRPGLTELPSADDWFFPPRPETHRVRCIRPDVQTPDRLHVGIELGAFAHSPNGGETWSEDVPGARRDTHQIVIHPEEPDRFYAASGFGYAESRDGGESWDRPEDGLTEAYEHLWSVAPDPGDPDTVIASTSADAFAAHFEPAETYVHRRTEDGGWESLERRGLPTGDGVFAASLAPGTASGEVYAVNNAGLFRTMDGGDSWSQLEVDWPEALEAEDPRGLVVVP